MAEDQGLIAPYLEWAVRTGFAYLDGEWFNVLLEVDGGAARFARDAERSALANLIWVAPAYRTALKGFKEEDITRFSAILHKGALDALLSADRSGDLAAALDKLGIKRIEFGTPTNNPFGKVAAGTSVRVRSAGQPASLRPSAVVAVIDDGLAFAHERFRDRNGQTRFKYFWNQDDTTGIGQPADFQSGREFSANDINGLLAAWTGPSGIVDEDALYRQAGQKLVGRRVKHGTHVMDVACGMDPVDVTPQSPYLIGVQLPSRVTERTSGVFLTPAVRDAIHYILTRADQIADDMGSAPLPVVVNISYGTIAGPHDGSGVFEASIDQLVADRPTPLRVVLPAGNHYLARCHALFDLPAGASQMLRWRVQPDDKAGSFMELWLPKLTSAGHRPQVEMRITTPTRESSDWISPGQHWHWPNDGDIRFWAVNYNPPVRRPRLFLAMAPTADLATPPRTAPAGTWLVELRNVGEDVAVEAWIQRGDTPFGYPLWGRQSRFDDSEYRRFDLAGRPWQDDTPPPNSYIRRHGSINALATGQRSIVVGGFRRCDRTPSVYSGSGPTSTPVTIPPQRTGPDAAAAADDSPVLSGLLAAGTRTGSVAALSGSSVAAPQITRRIAELMTSVLPSDRVAVQVGAAAGDPDAPGTNMILRERLGAGRIDRAEPVYLRWKLRS
jgi:hypothetical protein